MIRFVFVLFLLFLTVACNPCLNDFKYGVYGRSKELSSPGIFMKAWGVVYRDFYNRPELSENEKDLNNYLVTFYPSRTRIWVEFNPDPDRENSTTLKKLTYQVDRYSYKIVKNPFDE